jgi:hypothetical protein
VHVATRQCTDWHCSIGEATSDTKIDPSDEHLRSSPKLGQVLCSNGCNLGHEVQQRMSCKLKASRKEEYPAWQPNGSTSKGSKVINWCIEFKLLKKSFHEFSSHTLILEVSNSGVTTLASSVQCCTSCFGINGERCEHLQKLMEMLLEKQIYACGTAQAGRKYWCAEFRNPISPKLKRRHYCSNLA